jgi:hypothetical protein
LVLLTSHSVSFITKLPISIWELGLDFKNKPKNMERTELIEAPLVFAQVGQNEMLN